ncbi:MAG: substrate-binding domain-containing protein [Wenzhouxiangella sp.]|jgi:tungstate transport system substrate-binding protein|nr:substrate-binding domain-containing protein [Wenzhouxiangella sp.]
MQIRHLSLIVLIAALSVATPVRSQDFITVASTTSTENSGLFGHLLPTFQEQAGFDVRVIAVGTGAALQYGRRCDADVVMVHAPAAEQEFVDAGYGVERHPLMHNDFILVGLETDPAGIAALDTAAAALARIAEAEAAFVSRGDDSGTHKKELSLWQASDKTLAEVAGSWYREAGAGMGPTLNIARGMGAYTLTDRGTWLSFGNRGDMTILLEGDPELFNPYGVILVNPERCPTVKTEMAQQFIDWLLSDAGQRQIADFRLEGQPLFTPHRQP